MGYINIFISSPCKISIKNCQLVIKGEEQSQFPLEDINCVLIESHECIISSYALQALATYNIAVFLCDKLHLPNTIILPYNGYYRQNKTLKHQIAISKPLQKQLWQHIIKQKIINQASVLKCNNIDANVLINLAKNVQSGDAGNVEATAANHYFKLLFGNKFSRQNDNIINACLNYGYAIVRGIISRTLVCYGFQPCLGLHHCNELNAFNLSDDLIEPFRAVVDGLVLSNVDFNEQTLSPQIKHKIFSILNTNVVINNQEQSLSYAIEIMVQSLLSSLKSNTNNLLLPQLCYPLQPHSYE